MARNNLYKIEKKELSWILDSANGSTNENKAATIIIPDLQRPFRWSPVQVLRLVDSLIRGWPFGTLLLWELKSKIGEELEVPTRAFWQNISSTEEIVSKAYSKAGSPNTFLLVLDGQQRLQSLLLAAGGDAGGYYMYDREWADCLERERPRARYWKNFWSFAQLSLNIDEFLEQASSCDVRDVNYIEVLDWVICNGDNAMSKKSKPANYKHPLNQVKDENNITRYIQFSRLWSMAEKSYNFFDYYESTKLTQLFDTYNIEKERQEKLKKYISQLLEIIGNIKSMEVGYLQLLSFEESPLSSDTIKNGKDRYDDAVVQIFTRLNSGGTVLTPQEITFAWIKTKWDNSLTNNREAFSCFEELQEKMYSNNLIRNMDELVQVISHIWSAIFNNGNLLKPNDLLKGKIVSPMAYDICQIWFRLTDMFDKSTNFIVSQNIERSANMVSSLYALTVYWSWNTLYYEWKSNHELDVRKSDSFDKTIQEHLRKYTDRWLILSSWAGRWSQSAFKNLDGYIKDINKSWLEIKNISNFENVLDKIKNLMEQWLEELISDSKNYITNLSVDNRNRVREYYLALWVWHRLDKERWEKSQIPLRTSTRRKPNFHVDHLIADKLWERLYPVDDNDESNIITKDTITANDIGNMMLLETDFNISKSDNTLNNWMSEVHEFKKNRISLADWAKILNIPESFLEPLADNEEYVKTDVKSRTKLIKDDLIKYIQGELLIYPDN